MWEWWFKKRGTDDWSPITDYGDGVSIRVSDGIVVQGKKCPGKDGGFFEQMENSTGNRLSKLYPSKAFLKFMMEVE